MTEKEISQEKGLEIIQKMINLAKNENSDNGFHFMLWGILVIVASLLNYIFILLNSSFNPSLVWVIMPVIGVPFAFIYEFKRKKITRTKSHLVKFYHTLWLSFGITLSLIIYFSIHNNLNPIPFILVLVGLATFVSGSIYVFNPLIIGGIVFWVSGFLSILIPEPEQLLINALATFLGYIIPSILLRKKYKNESVI